MKNKKGIRKLALLMAVVCLTMGFQSAMSVKAASAPEMRTWYCHICHGRMYIEIKRDVRVRIEQGPKCTLREHAGTDCYIAWDVYIDQEWIICPSCGETIIQQVSPERDGNKYHRSYS